MQWTGDGLIIGVRRHGETSVIAELMVAGRGRCLGLVRGGRSSKQSATLQPGNSVQVTWRARLEEHLGTFVLELVDARAAALIVDRLRLYASQLACDHLRLLPERDPHDRLLGMAVQILDFEGDRLALGAALARFELILLDELGFGLDLTSCAATGTTRDLHYVSPKSGRAVSVEAAEPYKDRLLRLPQFLIAGGQGTAAEVTDAFALTGHFLDLHVWNARRIEAPSTRETLVRMLTDGA